MIFNNSSFDCRWRYLVTILHLAAIVVALELSGCETRPDSASTNSNAPRVSSATVDAGAEPSKPVEYATVENDAKWKGSNQLVLADPNCPPDPLADETANQTPKTSTCRKLWLGIQAEPAPQMLLDQFDLHCGLVVKNVVKGAPSDGLLNPSDLVCQFNGRDLACEKRLCAMIAEAGKLSCRLTVIRKTKRIEVEIVPQPIDILENGQIVQYTVLADDSPAGVVDMPRAQDHVAEKLRMFVVQPIFVVADSKVESSAPSVEQAGRLKLERIVSFGRNERGEQILIVQEAERTLNYTGQEIKSACPEVQKLWELLENRP